MIDQCIGVPLSEDQISDTVDGVISRSVGEHLARCAFCQRRVERAQRLETRLRDHLDRFACPDPLALCNSRLGLLSPVEQQAVREHLAHCPRCAADVMSFERLPSTVVETPPAPQRAEHCTQACVNRSRGWSCPIRRVRS